MKSFLESNRLLILILFLGLFLRIFNLSYPPSPVFDETHFVTYVSAYRNHEAHIDIHPPLGKIIYSIPLFFESSPVKADFFQKEIDQKTGKLGINLRNGPYNNFPYLNLRLVSVFFGLILTISFYLFLKNLTGEKSVALWGAFFMTLENSILLETRFILLNGMYLAFGFFALAFFLGERRRAILGGIFWGLALSVKIIAVVFLGPVVFWLLSRIKKFDGFDSRKFFEFTGTALLVFSIMVVFANNLLIPVNDRLALYEDYFEWLPKKEELPDKPFFKSAIAPYVRATVVELNSSFSGYSKGEAYHPSGSSWYLWPFMKNPMGYFPLLKSDEVITQTGNPPEPKIILLGNPFVWGLGTLAIGFLMLLTIMKRRWLDSQKSKIFGAILFGYIFSLLPFIFVERSTFLYHYFPALLFSIGLASVFISDHLKSLPSSQRKILTGLIIGLSVFSFLIISPFTYGL